jgi:hypothetical protein
MQFGVISSYAFVHPNSKYIGKFFALFTAWLGYRVHKDYAEAYNHSRLFGNFWKYPADIRRMIDNNDSRYAFKWLKDDYLAIEESQ